MSDTRLSRLYNNRIHGSSLKGLSYSATYLSQHWITTEGTAEPHEMQKTAGTVERQPHFSRDGVSIVSCDFCEAHVHGLGARGKKSVEEHFGKLLHDL